MVHTTWTKKDGAPIGINALAQTTDGYLWIGSTTGLVRFDGVRFVTFVPSGGDPLPAIPTVQRLLATRDGSLWIVWGGSGVSRLQNGRLTTYGERDGMPTAFQLAESRSGMLVAATVKGLSQFTNGKWADVSRAWGYPGIGSRAVWFDRDDALWAETEHRMVYRPSGANQFVDPGLREISTTYRADFAQQADGTTWMSVINGGARTLGLVGVDTTRIADIAALATGLLIDRKGALWITTYSDGVWRLTDPAIARGRRFDNNSRELERFKIKDGLLSNDPETILEDREGSIWLGSSRGLERFHEGDFTPFMGRGQDRPRFVFASRDSTLWVGSYNWLGIQLINARGKPDSVATSFVPRAFAQDKSGSVFTVDRSDIWRVVDKKLVRVPIRATKAANLFYVASDTTGNLWVLDFNDGLFRLERDSLVAVAPINEPVIHHYAMYGDTKGRMWIGTLSELVLFDHGTQKTFRAADGVPIGVTYGFFEDRGGALWVASAGGLSRFDNGRFRTISERQGIRGSSVFGLAQDETAAWWLATRAGMIRVP
ncbi:MAG: hypothetical protein ABI852_16730, partial [Gemmatimonadaceae bacterium]